MDAARLRRLSEELREGDLQPDDDVLAEVESTVAAINEAFRARPEREPPAELRDTLWSLGRLIYEASWKLTDDVEAAFESSQDEAVKRRSLDATARIQRLADAARRLRWPEYAPRALGAIRSQALAASKRDTERGYDDAWILHGEGREKYVLFREALTGIEEDRYVIGLDENFLQLALAETGTACRTAERVIGRWMEGLTQDPPSWGNEDEPRWSEVIYRYLTDGASTGEQALQVASEIEHRYGFVDAVSDERMALWTAYRNPGIMTARALVLLLPLCVEMEALERKPPGDHETWQSAQEDIRGRFESAYGAIERRVGDGEQVPYSAAHQRSLVQLRLNYALVVPGQRLESRLDFASCLQLAELDDSAVEALSAWLAETVDGRRRGDANVIGSATMPRYMRAVERCRVDYGAPADFGYLRWREQWPQLDRYFDEPGREQSVKAALEATRQPG